MQLFGNKNLLNFSRLAFSSIFARQRVCKIVMRAYNIREMYELLITSGADCFGWLEKIESDVCRSCTAVSAVESRGHRAYLCIGAERRIAGVVRRLAARSLGEIFLTDVKRGYIERRIRRMRLPALSRSMLVHALAGFDRESEKGILCGSLRPGRVFDIDGFRMFRMGELYERWNEMCELAGRHGEFLADERTFFELIRFLVESGRRAGSRAEVYRIGGKYRLVETCSECAREEFVLDGFDELVCRLIDFAPAVTVVSGFDRGEDFRRLGRIFDIRHNISEITG